MAKPGTTPDASETKRAEDSIQAGYDKDGNRKDFLTSELKDGKLPEGYTGTPPEWAHPNRKGLSTRPPEQPEQPPEPPKAGKK